MRPPTGSSQSWSATCVSRSGASDGMMRQPIYLGLRDDIDPNSVCTGAAGAGQRRWSRHAATRSAESTPEEVKVDGRTITMTNLDKVFWPDDNLTKRDVVSYYRGIAPAHPALPGRPPAVAPPFPERDQRRELFPEGRGGSSAGLGGDGERRRGRGREQRERRGRVPALPGRGDADADGEHGLHRSEPVELPTRSPGPARLSRDRPRPARHLVRGGHPRPRSKRTACSTRRKSRTTCKTSGATGMHIYVPLGAKYPYDQVRELARLVAYLINDRLPQTTSVERSPEKRKGKIYLDFLQNRRGPDDGDGLLAPTAPRRAGSDSPAVGRGPAGDDAGPVQHPNAARPPRKARRPFQARSGRRDRHGCEPGAA